MGYYQTDDMGNDPAVVLIDLDDTICRYRRSTGDLLEVGFDRTGVEPFFTVEEYVRWIPKVTGNSPLDLREKCFRGIAREKGRSEVLAEKVAANVPERDPTAVEFVPGADRALAFLSNRYDLGLVSNGVPEAQQTKLETLGIADMFDVLTFGTPETGVKPRPEPFRQALDSLGCSQEEAIHIGNSLEADVAGAQAAQVPAVWLKTGQRDPTAPSPEYVIDEMSALHDDPLPWEAPPASAEEPPG